MKLLYQFSFRFGTAILQITKFLELVFFVDFPLSCFRNILLGFGQGVNNETIVEFSEQMTRRHVIISYAMTIYGFLLYYAVRHILTRGF